MRGLAATQMSEGNSIPGRRNSNCKGPEFMERRGVKRKEQEGMKSEGQEGNGVCMWRENRFRLCSHNKDYSFSSE